MSSAQFHEWLKDDNRSPVILCDMDFVYEGAANTVVTNQVHLADHPYRTEPTDVLADKQYRDVIASVPNFSRSIDRATLGGRGRASVGSLELDNQDGSLDFMLGIICDGQEARFYYGDKAWPRDQFVLAFTAIIESVNAPNQDRISVKLRTRELLLNVAYTAPALGGTGQNKDRPTPILMGAGPQIEPLLYDQATLEYVCFGAPFESGAIRTGNIYEDGLLLDNAAAQVVTEGVSITANTGTDIITSAGHPFINEDVISFDDAVFGGIVPFQQYWVRNRTATTYQLSLTRTGAILNITTIGSGITSTISYWGGFWHAYGKFYLAHSSSKRITVDISNYNAHWSGAPSRQASEISYYVAQLYGGLPANKWGGYHWSLVPYEGTPSGANDLPCSLYLTERFNVADVLDQLAFAGNHFWAFNRNSELVLGRIRPDSIESQGLSAFGDVPTRGMNDPYLITQDDIEDLRIEHLLPAYKYVNTWTRMNHTVLDTIAGSVTADAAALRRSKGFYARQAEVADAGYDVTPWRWHPTMVVSPDFESIVSGLIDSTAITIAQPWILRRRDMFLPHVEIVEFDATLEIYEAELGDRLILQYPRFGFTGGVTLQVIGLDISLSSGKIHVQAVWRRLPEYLTGNYDA